MTGTVRVLHVDDEPDLAETVAAFLQREWEEFAVETATNASEGLDRLAAGDIDCVVSDYDMPGRNGIEFLRAVREEYPDLPFVLYTGKGSEEVASDAISAGVTDYLQKERGTSQYAVLANRVRNAVEKYRAQQELADRQQRLNLFFEQSPLGVIEWDEEFRVVRANASATEILGYSEEDLVGEPWETIVPESDRERVDEVVSKLLGDEGGYHSVNENVHEDGDRITCEWHNRVVTDDDGDVVSIFSQFQDITERVARKRELEAQATAMDAATDGIAILDRDHEFTYMNASHARIYGFDEPDDLVGRTWRACYDESTIPRFEDEILPALAEDGEWQGEMRVTTADGRALDQELMLTRVSDGRVVCVVRDITDRRRREQELAATRNRMELALQEMNAAVWDLDLDTREVTHYPSARSLYGDEIDTVDDALERIHPDDRQRVRDVLETVTESEEYAIEYRITGVEDEGVRWISSQGRVEFDEPDGPARVLGVEYDITERKERERAIRALHETAQDLWTAETPEAVGEIVVAAGRDILDMPVNSVHLYDDETDRLEPVAVTEKAADLIGEIPSFERGEGLAWEVFETGEPRFYDDVSTVPGRFNPETNARSEMILPLPDQGILLVGSPRRDAFDETDISLMRTLATHATRALDQIEREGHLTALQERTQRLMHTPTKEATARAAVEAAHDIINSPSCGVHLLTESGDALAPAAFLDTLREDFDPPTYERAAENDPVSAVVWEAFEGEDPVEIDDTRERASLAGESPVRSTIIHPLDGYGVFLVTAAQPHAFDTTDKSVIEILATALTTALDRVQRETHMQQRERALERQNERLEEFAGIVSHDLRNPLNVAQGRIELAREESGSAHLDPAAAAIERSLSLIDDLLTLAREGEAMRDMEPVPLSETIRGCWDAVETGTATLSVEREGTIRADRSRLKQLLENLMRNAIEHGGENVTVRVGLLADATGFYVADDGVGIPESERERVFESGYSGSNDGTGLGLGIVKRIADAHGWDVSVTESRDGGARFEVTGIETDV